MLLLPNVLRRRVCPAALVLILGQSAFAQTSPASSAPAAEAERKDQSVVLSPFLVSDERDTGYAATDTLAGTRLRTSLKDIAASVSVITKDFLDDIGATGTGDLLVYTT